MAATSFANFSVKHRAFFIVVFRSAKLLTRRVVMNSRQYSFTTVITALLIAAVLLSDKRAQAQPVPTKLPDSVQVFPAGAQRGTSTPIRVVVEQTPPGAKFFIRGAGVAGDSDLTEEVFDRGEPSPRRAPTEIPIHYPRQWAGRITVADDAPIGTAYWDISCAAGGSSATLPFLIGSLDEFVESESNSKPETAEPIELPVTVNGQIHGERDLDYFRFELLTGQVVYCEMLARRIGSQLEPTVVLLDSAGQPVPYQEDQLGDDPLLAFKAPADGHYLLQVGNVSHHGSPAHVYRVNLTLKATAPTVFPTGAPAGVPTTFSFTVLSGDGDVTTWERELTLSAEQGDTFMYVDELLANTIPLRVLPPDTSTNQASIRVGQVSNGHASPNSRNVYALPIETSVPLDVRVISESAAGGPSLVVMEIVDPNGKSIHRTNLSPPTGSVKAYHFIEKPLVGTYEISISNLDGPSERKTGSYQLEVLPANPDFRLLAGRDCLGVTQGGSIEIPITVTRIGGFAGPIEVKLHASAGDITVENSTIPAGKSSVKLKLSVPETAPSQRREIQLTGTAEIDEQSIVRSVQAQHRGRDSGGRAVGESLRSVIALTVRHKPVFRLHCEEAYQYAHRGTIYPYKMTLERLDGFKEPVIIQQADRQNRDLDGIQFIRTTIAPDEAEFMMPLYLPETMHINIQSQSQLYTQAFASFTDAHGVAQHFLVVAEKRNMLRTMPTVAKLYSQEKILSASPGQTVVAKFKLERTSNMRNPLQLKLQMSGLENLQTIPQNLARDEVHTAVSLTIPADSPPGRYELVFEATGQLDAKPNHTVVTSAQVTLEVQPK
jgi:hypothetical protein